MESYGNIISFYNRVNNNDEISITFGIANHFHGHLSWHHVVMELRTHYSGFYLIVWYINGGYDIATCYLEEALKFIVKIPIKLEPNVWMCFLGTCIYKIIESDIVMRDVNQSYNLKHGVFLVEIIGYAK